MLITKPLMRGTAAEVDGGKRTLWCPFEFEYCPDFYFICGIIGHQDKECSEKLKKGEEPQFGKWMKWIPPKHASFSDSRRNWSDGGSKRQGSWGSGGSRRGTDAPSWRREDLFIKNSSRSMGVGKDVSSSLKITNGNEKG
jgi:hypothetical protein